MYLTATHFLHGYVMAASFASQFRQMMVMMMRCWQIITAFVTQIRMFLVDRQMFSSFQQLFGQQMSFTAMRRWINAIAPTQSSRQAHQIISQRQVFVSHARHLIASFLQFLFD